MYGLRRLSRVEVCFIECYLLYKKERPALDLNPNEIILLFDKVNFGTYYYSDLN